MNNPKNQQTIRTVEEKLNYVRERMARRDVCEDALAGIEDVPYFMKNIKNEIEVMLKNTALILEGSGENEFVINLQVLNILEENCRRIAFMLSLFPKEKQDE